MHVNSKVFPALIILASVAACSLPPDRGVLGEDWAVRVLDSKGNYPAELGLSEGSSCTAPEGTVIEVRRYHQGDITAIDVAVAEVPPTDAEHCPVGTPFRIPYDSFDSMWWRHHAMERERAREKKEREESLTSSPIDR